jgi:hypothetical protein
MPYAPEGATGIKMDEGYKGKTFIKFVKIFELI